MASAGYTRTIYRSEEVVPFRRPEGDLDSRYMPQVYALVRNWASNPAEYGEGVLATYRQPVVNLGYQVKGTRIVLCLVPIESEPDDVVMTETTLWPSLTIGEVMRTLQEAWQNIPVLNP
ncbi:hypothetical protein [Pseudenterobacter timonensis]|uniref:hypothetical protein n=1 Tax=Pseudenterobacter timonensis TaxID=1755099 RepID=UPI00077B6F79|nr:hypothetical protein [Pseudenterobacter timonensis]